MASEEPARPDWYRPPEPPPAPTPARPDPERPPGGWVRTGPVYYHDPERRPGDGERSPERDPAAVATAPVEHAEPAPADVREPSRAGQPAAGAAAPEPATAAAAEREALEAGPSASARRRVPLRAALAAVVGVALLSGAGLVVRQLTGAHRLSIPATLNRLPLLATPPSGARTALSASGWSDPAAGAYGSGTGQLLLELGRPPHDAAQDGAFLHTVSAALQQQGVVFNPSQAGTASVAGVDIACGPAAAADSQVVLCAWSDGDASGLLVDYAGATVQQTRDLTAAARAAAER